MDLYELQLNRKVLRIVNSSRGSHSCTLDFFQILNKRICQRERERERERERGGGEKTREEEDNEAGLCQVETTGCQHNRWSVVMPSSFATSSSFFFFIFFFFCSSPSLCNLLSFQLNTALFLLFLSLLFFCILFGPKLEINTVFQTIQLVSTVFKLYFLLAS